jgi:N-methylhydantoinase A
MPVEVVAFRVQINVNAEPFLFPELPRRGKERLRPRGVTTIRHLFQRPIDVPEYRRDDLCALDVIDGPAIVREAVSTTFVMPEQRLSVGRLSEMVITGPNRP